MSVLPIGVRLWATATVVLSLAAFGYGVGPDGEPFGKFVLCAAALGSLLFTLFLIGVRDGTVAPAADRNGEQEAGAPLAAPVPPTAPAFWPIGGALAAGIALAGLVSSTALVWIGIVLGAVIAVEWMVQGWAEHATPDPEENRRLRHRVMYPFEIPAIAAGGVLVVVLGFSRVLLALPESWSTGIAIAVAAAILGTATLVASRPQIRSGLVAIVGVIGGVALIGGGIAGAVAGQRTIEPHSAGGETRTVTVVAQDISFDKTRIEAHVGETIEVELVNKDDGVSHNIAFVDLPGDPATKIGEGPNTDTVALTLDKPGEYTYECQVHPTQMRGTLVVTEDQGGGGGGTEGGSGG